MSLEQTLSRAAGGLTALCALGANAWATSVGWMLLPADVSTRERALAAVTLLPLFGGALLHARGRTWTRAQDAARWLLLCIYPAALAAALCLRSEAERERAHTPLSFTLAALSLIAYGIAAVQSCRAPLPLLPAVHNARKTQPIARPLAQRRMHAIASVVLLAGAALIAVWAPLTPNYGALQSGWSDGAPAGAVLCAVTGGALAVSVVALQLGSLLQPRAAERRSTLRQRRTRIASFLFLGLLGGVVYFNVLR